jgi:hypothetical protein
LLQQQGHGNDVVSHLQQAKVIRSTLFWWCGFGTEDLSSWGRDVLREKRFLFDGVVSGSSRNRA